MKIKLGSDHRGQTVAQALRLSGANLMMPCGGNGTCGKCAVRIKGAVELIGEDERRLLSNWETPPDPHGYVFRMACLCRLRGEAEVILTGSGTPHRDTLTPMHEYNGTGRCGVAVDIGTTTVSMLLLDMGTGDVIAQSHEWNRQQSFGADVISRISHASEHGPAIQQERIVTQLNEMLLSTLSQLNVPRAAVEGAVVVGNTTMLHLLVGLDPTGIGVAPFKPLSLFGSFASVMGCDAYLPRCIGAYTGADVSAGLVATGLCDQGETRLLVDIGTNGEMALYAKGRLWCCSTAAGPVFEGVGVSCGMTAQAGAVHRVVVNGGSLHIQTIDGMPAKGICGTGLISAVYALIGLGAVDETGKLVNGQRYILGDGPTGLTQRDIRNVQLAKAAIAAGIDTLLHAAGITAKDVDALYLCGGLGSAADPKEAAGIGLIPSVMMAKTVSAGNTALEGARQMLLNPAKREKAQRLAALAEEIDLSTNPYFAESYIEHMAFEA